METESKTKITVETTVNAPVDRVWKFWTTPEHITQWNFAADSWHSPTAENDLRPGGRFVSRMEAKDGSMGFDFEGVYDEVKTNELIAYTLGDDRKVTVTFRDQGNQTKVVETFEAERQNPLELQQGGWQAILDNFKKHVEATEAF
ncbi:SRPBCC family protein [Pedobacter immunditicola]|uniref:SRPBCC family protein n=1 Tax=Pedobacter immunditicola TaxID=3133440 RepID=UPI0030A7C9A2